MNSNKSIYTPYTYLVGWSHLNLWYYGARYAKVTNCLYETGCHPDDFWVTYHTSSDRVQELREAHGEPDVLKVRKTFATAEEAIVWETRVIGKLPLGDDSPWLNLNRAGTPVMTKEIRLKISEANKGKTYSAEAKRKMSEAKKGNTIRKGKTHSAEAKRKMSEAHKGKTHSAETRRKMSEAGKGRKWWNNGEQNTMARACPGSGWVQGMMR